MKWLAYTFKIKRMYYSSVAEKDLMLVENVLSRE